MVFRELGLYIFILNIEKATWAFYKKLFITEWISTLFVDLLKVRFWLPNRYRVGTEWVNGFWLHKRIPKDRNVQGVFLILCMNHGKLWRLLSWSFHVSLSEFVYILLELHTYKRPSKLLFHFMVRCGAQRDKFKEGHIFKVIIDYLHSYVLSSLSNFLLERQGDFLGHWLTCCYITQGSD